MYGWAQSSSLPTRRPGHGEFTDHLHSDMSENKLLRERVAKLQAHNELLKSQLELQRNFAPPDSKTKSVLEEIMKWFDNVPPPADELLAAEHSGLHALSPPADTPPCSTSTEQTTQTPEKSTSEVATGTDDDVEKPSPHAVHNLSFHPGLNISDLASSTPAGRPAAATKISSITDCKFPTRILGEVAFQLDRRILSYVFNGQCPMDGSVPPTWRQRFYGFTVQNIPEMIDVESRDRSGRMDNSAKMSMSYRHMHIMRALAQLGYDSREHALFSMNLVNTHGLMHAEDRRLEAYGLQDPDVARRAAEQLLLSVAVTEEARHFMILFNCLVYMATDDGKPLFIF